MDRNKNAKLQGNAVSVALRKESVDRNCCAFDDLRKSAVALRKESVDRNPNGNSGLLLVRKVALRKESVDRNAPALLRRVIDDGRSPQGERG